MFRPTAQLASIISSRMRSAPFSRAVFGAMRQLYPEELADKSWDNTGLLLEAPFDPLRRQKNSVLLTVDLTKGVADEAIKRKSSVIVAYHPIIFRGLKSITMNDTQQQSLLRLAAEGISVYSPHTALDSAEGGINDWLADIITGLPATVPESIEQAKRDGALPPTPDVEDPFVVPKRPVYLLAHHPSQAFLKGKDLRLSAVEHTRSTIRPLDIAVPSHPNAGQGRVVRFQKPQPLNSLIDRVSSGLGHPKGFPVAIPQGANIDSLMISSVGICAGSGGSMLSALRDVDLLFTGEMSHHEALAAIERGQCVITLFHSNSERGFLHAVLRDQLEKRLKEEWDRVREEDKSGKDVSEELLNLLNDDEVVVEISEQDRDPYGIVIAN